MSEHTDSSPPVKPRYSQKQVTLFAVFLVLLVPGLIVLAEFSARAVMSMVYGVKGKSYGIYSGDPVLGHIPAPNTYNHLTSLNDRAFRNRENVIEPKPKGALRMIAYGGSTTFSYNLPTEKTWTYLLQRRLRERLGGQTHQVLNGGVVLWSLSHAYERAKREIPVLKPDYVLLYSGINEETNALYLKASGPGIQKLVVGGKFGVPASNYIASSWLHRNSLLFKIFRKYLVPFVENIFKTGESGPYSGEKPDVYVLTNYLKVLDSFVALARRNDAKFIFIIQSGRDQGPGMRRITGYSVKGAEHLRPLGVKVIDTRDMIRRYKGKPEELFETSIHYSEKGARVFADYLFERIFGNP
ncbi:MAG: hypothetical protein IIC04_08415 [Proteobacteria bacterium]|nr:hypothetical protein [Pseudomonadota bacterium]